MSLERRWQRFLLPGERVIHDFGVSRVYLTLFFLLPTLALFAAGFYSVMTGQILGALFLIAGLGLVLPTLTMWFFVRYAITDHRVMSRVGILSKHSVSVDLTAITDMMVREPFWERLLTRSGTIGLNTAGGSTVELVLSHVARPNSLKQDIYKHTRELVEKTQQQSHGVAIQH